jgi:2-polyprenyl-3-methyl-5-hydroxy-6-metoxy-1,4-benzoquinol methylase
MTYSKSRRKSVDDRAKEIEKYRNVYSRYSHYAMSDDRLFPVMAALKGYTGDLLDVSCGRGELLRAAANTDFTSVTGTEAVPELCGGNIHQAVITDLPFRDKSFDVVTCIDVIEHILEPDIIPALKELERVCRGVVIIAAADYPTYWDGVNLHPSARPYQEWDRLFTATFSGKVRRLGPTSTSEMWSVTYGV